MQGGYGKVFDSIEKRVLHCGFISSYPILCLRSDWPYHTACRKPETGINCDITCTSQCKAQGSVLITNTTRPRNRCHTTKPHQFFANIERKCSMNSTSVGIGIGGPVTCTGLVTGASGAVVVVDSSRLPTPHPIMHLDIYHNASREKARDQPRHVSIFPNEARALSERKY